MPAEAVTGLLAELGALARHIGETGGTGPDAAITMGGAEVALSVLREAHEGWLPGVMG